MHLISKILKKPLNFHRLEARNFLINVNFWAIFVYVPLNTSILKNKTLVSRCKDLTVPVQIPPLHPGKGKILQPRARTTDKDLSGSAKRGQVTGCVQKAE